MKKSILFNLGQNFPLIFELLSGFGSIQNALEYKHNNLGLSMTRDLNHDTKKTCLRKFSTRPDTNWPAQPQKLARVLKFRL